LSKTWLHYETATANEDKNTFFAKDVALRAALATEASVASWAVLRAGVQSSVWGSDQYDRTTYEKVDYSGKSEKVSRSSTFWMREAAQPTLGVGFKFGNYTIDATLAQDGSGDLGFTDKFLGQVEITAQY
jgi:hypothetical protein